MYALRSNHDVLSSVVARWTATAGSFGNFGLFINIACMRVNNRTIK